MGDALGSLLTVWGVLGAAENGLVSLGKTGDTQMSRYELGQFFCFQEIISWEGSCLLESRFNWNLPL